MLENVRARGAELEARLREIAGRYPICGEVRGRGLLYCLDFVDPVTRGPLAADAAGRHGRAAGGAGGAACSSGRRSTTRPSRRR